MNVKINDKQKSNDRTAEEQTSDNRHLRKIFSRRTAFWSLLTKFFADENFLLYSSFDRNLSLSKFFASFYAHDIFFFFMKLEACGTMKIL